jgi:hypothetical protein
MEKTSPVGFRREKLRGWKSERSQSVGEWVENGTVFAKEFGEDKSSEEG